MSAYVHACIYIQACVYTVRCTWPSHKSSRLTWMYFSHSNLFKQLWSFFTQSLKKHDWPLVRPHAQQREQQHCGTETPLGFHSGFHQFSLILLHCTLRVQVSKDSSQGSFRQLLNDLPFQQMYYKSVVIISSLATISSITVVSQQLMEPWPAW